MIHFSISPLVIQIILRGHVRPCTPRKNMLKNNTRHATKVGVTYKNLNSFLLRKKKRTLYLGIFIQVKRFFLPTKKKPLTTTTKHSKKEIKSAIFYTGFTHIHNYLKYTHHDSKNKKKKESVNFFKCRRKNKLKTFKTKTILLKIFNKLNWYCHVGR